MPQSRACSGVTSPIHFVQFMKAQIGYSANDSAAQLSKSVRFLGLAAALLTLGTFKGAKTLHSMMAETASGYEALPTVSHLKDLLNVLEHKLVQTSFAESVADWTIWYTNNALFSDSERQALGMQNAPQQQELALLVDALRQIGRLGDAIQVTVTVIRCAPWVTAFIKWSLGMPPSIISAKGISLLEQADCNITPRSGTSRGNKRSNITAIQ